MARTMLDGWRTLQWDRADAFTRGPLAAERTSAPDAFEVPRSPAPGFAFGRLVAGPAWPAEILRVERRAAVPVAAAIQVFVKHWVQLYRSSDIYRGATISPPAVAGESGRELRGASVARPSEADSGKQDETLLREKDPR